MRSPMRVVVTGASGNLGTALMRRLQGSPHSVVGVVRRPPEPQGPYAGADWVALDLTAADARSRMQEVLEGADVCVHLAWGFQPMHNRRYLRRIDVGGTATALRAALDAGVPHFVQGSSVAAYAPGDRIRLVDESWPTGGIPSSTYSRHKGRVEALLDEVEQAALDRVVITRIRPALVGQQSAGSAMLRCGFPMAVPPALLRHVPVMPLDREFAMQFTQSDDIAEALARIIDLRPRGAFNLVADPVVRQEDVAAAFGARPVHVPIELTRRLASAAFRARLQPLDPGWLDMAFGVPLVDAGRARRELGWQPRFDGPAALAELVSGLAHAGGEASPSMRPRALADDLRSLVRYGPVTRRRLT